MLAKHYYFRSSSCSLPDIYFVLLVDVNLKLDEENKDTSWGLEYNYEPGHNDSRGINENPTPTLKLK